MTAYSRISLAFAALGFLSCFAPLPAHAAPPPTAFLRSPDIHGDQVVFTAEGDLWLGSIDTGHASRITSYPGYEGDAHFSPDGSMLAFDAQYDSGGDVYVMPVLGGEPRRLTYEPSPPRVIGWTPDGKNVLYRAHRQTPEPADVLLSVPVKGGEPTLLPIPRVEHASMNADGFRVAYVPVSAEWQHWFHYEGGEADQVWMTDLRTHSFTKLTDDPFINTTPIWVGNALYFVSEQSGVANLYRQDPGRGPAAQVTSFADYPVRYPSTDGKRIVFEHGDGLGLYDPITGQATDLTFSLHSDRIHARPHRLFVGSGVDSITIGPTGKRVLADARGQLLSIPVEHGDTRVLDYLPGARSQYPCWSPDGKNVAFISDRSGEEEIWVGPAEGPGEPHQLTKDHKGPLGPMDWSPDGKWIAVGDHEERIFLVDATTGAMTLVDQSKVGGTYASYNGSFSFSPDGKWLTFTRTELNYNNVVYLYRIADAKKVAVTSSDMGSFDPAFDSTGKYLLFLSDRDFNPRGSGTDFFAVDKVTRISLITLAADTPSPFLPQDDEEGAEEGATTAAAAASKTPAASTASSATPAAKPAPAPKLPTVKVELDGIQDRVVDVPTPADRYWNIEGVDGKLYWGVNIPDNGDGPSSRLVSFDLKKKETTVLADNVSGFEISNDNKKLLVHAGADYAVVDVTTGPFNPHASHIDFSGAMIRIDPAAEWKQIFNEAWRVGRDFFYDPGMQGVDWDAVRARYEAELPAVADRSDLNRILGDMIAELNVGHAFVGGGDSGGVPAHPAMGYLGADLQPDPTGKAYRIVKLYPGDGFDLSARSPLLAPGLNVKVGDFILAVEGQPVSTDQDIQALLIGTAGRVISLTVNTRPTLDGARDIRIQPMASESKTRYYDWVERKRDYVESHGGPNIGYIHLPDMEEDGLREFTKHYYANLKKDAIIYDVRYNSGGYISAMLLLQMASRPYSYFKPRYGLSWTREDWAFAGYSAALCNEETASNGEEFCDAFQRLKVGPVIGVRTWGGEVGSGGGWRLMDGGTIYIPNYAEWVPGAAPSWVIEGTGAHPDMVVENDPAAVLAGRDPQLDRAIAYLQEQLKKAPIVQPAPPPYPKKNWRVAAKRQ